MDGTDARGDERMQDATSHEMKNIFDMMFGESVARARGFGVSATNAATARENPPRAVVMDRRGRGKRPRDDDVDRAASEPFSPASFDWEVRVSIRATSQHASGRRGCSSARDED